MKQAIFFLCGIFIALAIVNYKPFKARNIVVNSTKYKVIQIKSGIQERKIIFYRNADSVLITSWIIHSNDKFNDHDYIVSYTFKNDTEVYFDNPFHLKDFSKQVSEIVEQKIKQ